MEKFKDIEKIIKTGVDNNDFPGGHYCYIVEDKIKGNYYGYKMIESTKQLLMFLSVTLASTVSMLEGPLSPSYKTFLFSSITNTLVLVPPPSIPIYILSATLSA